MTLIVVGYLMVGALFATLIYFMLDWAIKHRSEAPTDGKAALSSIERSAAGTPGGMATLLLVIAALWPWAMAIMLRSHFSHRKG